MEEGKDVTDYTVQVNRVRVRTVEGFYESGLSHHAYVDTGGVVVLSEPDSINLARNILFEELRKLERERDMWEKAYRLSVKNGGQADDPQ